MMPYLKEHHVKRGWGLLVAVFLMAGADAQHSPDSSHNSMTLDEVWERAELYNKQILQKQLQLQGSEEALRDARAERLPEINAEAEYARVSNLPLYKNGLLKTPEQFPVLHTYYRLGGDAYLNLYNGRRTSTKIAAGEVRRQLADEQKNMTRSDVKLRSASGYLDLLRSLLFKSLLVQHMAEQEKQLQQIRELRKNGVVLKTDVLRAELELSRQQLSLEQIGNDITLQQQQLALLIGLPDTTALVPVVDTSGELPSLNSYETYEAAALSHAYPVRISEKETALLRLQLRDVKASVLPRFGLFANYAFSYPEIQFYPYVPALYGLGMAGVRASLPLSALYHDQHKEKAAEIAYRVQELAHADTQDQVRHQVKEAYLRYQEAVNRVRVAANNVQQATENLRIVHNTYFNQLSLLTDLLDADTQVLQTRFDLTAARIAARFLYYQLLSATGNL